MKSTLHIDDIDLNLLRVFHHLLVLRRVSRVATVLGVSQPAVSNALARLRRLLGDELFVRTPNGMEPTPYAEQLGASVGPALASLGTALARRSGFDPRRSDRLFTLGMTDIGEIYFLPAWMERLASAAPGVCVSTVRNTALNLKDDMAEGKVDLAIGHLPQLQAGFFQQRLFQQRYVCLFRQGHALDGEPVSATAFSQCEHVVVVSEGTGHHAVGESLQQQGIARRVRLKVPHFVAVGHILQASNMVATVPERFAQRMVQPFGLAYAAHPVQLPEVTIHAFWHARFHQDAANQWLRQQLFDQFADAV